MFANAVGLDNVNTAHYQKIDFDNWLRRCVTPGRKFVGLQEAYSEHIKSFG